MEGGAEVGSTVCSGSVTGFLAEAAPASIGLVLAGFIAAETADPALAAFGAAGRAGFLSFAFDMVFPILLKGST